MKVQIFAIVNNLYQPLLRPNFNYNSTFLFENQLLSSGFFSHFAKATAAAQAADAVFYVLYVNYAL